jgi:hypothetical protein
VAGPLSNEALPQIFAGGELGHDPFGAGSVVAVGAAVVVGGAVVGGAVVGGAVVGGAVVGGAVVGGAVVVVGVGEGVVVVAPLLATVKCARRLEVVPSDRVSTTLMR